MESDIFSLVYLREGGVACAFNSTLIVMYKEIVCGFTCTRGLVNLKPFHGDGNFHTKFHYEIHASLSTRGPRSQSTVGLPADATANLNNT